MVKDYVTMNDLKKLQNELIPLRYRLIYTTLFFSAMRPGELLIRKPKDFTKEYSEDKDKHYFFFELKTQKNGTENELTPIRQQDYVALIDFIRQMNIGPDDYIFGSSRYKYKKPMSVSWLDRKLAEHLKLIGLNKKITAHSFRSGLVTYLHEEKNMPYSEIATITRHQNIHVMQKHYDKRIKYTAYSIIDNI